MNNTAGVTNFLDNGLEQRVAKSGAMRTASLLMQPTEAISGPTDAVLS
ncbi:hypothetical protein [Leptothrix ochracea]